MPVVVGGTMMYHQWLVHGQPAAPPSDPAVTTAVEAELAPLRAAGDWTAGIALLAAALPERVDKLEKNDWYRLSRALEIVQITGGGEAARTAFSGGRVRRGAAADFDCRCFFLVRPRCPAALDIAPRNAAHWRRVEALMSFGWRPQIGERARICTKIDRRCEAMLGRGLLEETAELLQAGVLLPATTAGKSIGYRQATEYLLAPPSAEPEPADRFSRFLAGFCTVSRQYATEQMKWFRKDKAYLWVRSELEKPTEAAART